MPPLPRADATRENALAKSRHEPDPPTVSRPVPDRPPAYRVMRIIAAGLLVAALWRPAWAGLESGVAAYDGGDYIAAYRELYPLAEQGDAIAAYLVSRMLFAGQGVSRNAEAA